MTCSWQGVDDASNCNAFLVQNRVVIDLMIKMSNLHGLQLREFRNHFWTQPQKQKPQNGQATHPAMLHATALELQRSNILTF